ncbi:MAG: DUF1553 domain-containing protein [Verrucomicrobia bacterium]|nr:DUF1553 domain-containing protein [Verrucomicrobiota bacterium]
MNRPTHSGERTRPRVQWSAPSPTTPFAESSHPLAIGSNNVPTGEAPVGTREGACAPQFLLFTALWLFCGALSSVDSTAASSTSGPAETPESRVRSDSWALHRLTEPQPPAVVRSDWAINAIDRFILSRLEAEGLAPSPRADRTTLLRRVTFDLIGLPPTPEELENFLNDSSLRAYEKVVDRLLASPHFGERWARHWLDVVRFAESDGFERNTLRPHAWPYRDWVIQAFNDDLPYDEFVRLQLAGDVLKPDDPGAVIATGYLVAGAYDLLGSVAGTEAMQTATRQDQLEDIVGNLGQTFLGLTIQCARCHDHKFDPIPQKEYYQIASVIGGVWPGARELLSEKARSATQQKHDELAAAIEKLRPSLSAIEGSLRQQAESELLAAAVKFAEASQAKASKAVEEAAVKLVETKKKTDSAAETDKDKLEKELEKTKENLASKTREWESAKAATAKARESKPRAPYGMILDRLPEERRSEYRRFVFAISQLEMRRRLLSQGTVAANVPKQPKPFHVLQRGDFRSPGEIVRPAGIAALAGPKADFGLAPDGPEAPRRVKLAEWITDPLNPLLARVIVNRLWHYHFGAGLVDTPNDFGANGGRPSHPELLDWLARELMREDWSLKKLHKLIVTSATYRQSSRSNAEAARTDGSNRWLWRKSPQRLEAEAIRDAMLSVCGELNQEMGGPSYRDVEPEKSGDNTGYRFVGGFNGAFNRRTVYRTWIRRVNHPLLEAMDCADPSISIPRRTVTTTPLQALALLNNPFMTSAAEAFARRLTREAGGDPVRQIRRAYRLAYLREPAEEETASAQRFIAEHGLSEFCLVLFNSNEFVYVD